jgi:HTH-type transcriptional regulator/antitoxin HipB
MLIRSPKDLALFVTDQRKKLNLSQADAAKLVGLKQQTLSAFENKPEGTKLETLFHILSAVNIDITLAPKNTVADKKHWKEEW